MNRYSSLACLLLAASTASAQSIYFSPVDATPVLLNASYTGMFDGKVRISTLYQNTWQTISLPYSTYGVSADMPVFVEHNGSYLAAGLQVLRDQGGDGNLSNFYGVASVAYHKILSKPRNERSCELAIGLQGGYSQKMMDIAASYFADDFNIPYRSRIGNSVNSYTINSGISFSQSTSRKFSYSIGLAGNNLNQPVDAVEKNRNAEVGLDPYYSISFGANWLMGKRLILRPAVYICTRARHTNLIYGSELQYNFDNGSRRTFVTNVFAGTWFRSGNGFTCMVGTQFWNFRIGIGADTNVGSYSPANGSLGSVLCQVSYIAPQRASTRKRTVSCNRF